MAAENYEQVHPETREEWRAWLDANHATSPGVWVVSWKKSTGRPSIGYDALVEEALCFGWVDSLPRSLDAERSMNLLTPRKPTSRWSRVNKQRVESLLARGLMTPAGVAVVEQAKANGAWTALDAVEELEVPDDLQQAFDDAPGSFEQWLGFPRSVKRAILEWILDARSDATRAKRVHETAEKAARGERANQWRQPKGR